MRKFPLVLHSEPKMVEVEKLEEKKAEVEGTLVGLLDDGVVGKIVDFC